MRICHVSKIGLFQYNIGSFEYLYWIYPIFRSGHFPILLRPSPQYWIDPIPLFDRSNSSYLRIVLIRGPTLRGFAWMSATENNTEHHLVVLRELSWLPGNMLARFSARSRDFRASAREFRKCKVGAYPSVTIAVAETNAGNIVHTVGILIV